jgi:hypothetical protein
MKKTADLPNWAWLGVIVVGAGVGYYFVKKQQSTASAPALTATAPGSSASMNAQNAIDPATGIPYANEVGNQPVTPDYSNLGNPTSPVYVISSPTSPAPPAPAPPAPAPPVQYITTVSGASLESTPHDSNGGKNILTLPLGAILTYESGPVPDPNGGQKSYYLVSYSGNTGYVGSDVIQPYTGSTGGGKGAGGGAIRRDVRIPTRKRRG